MKRFWRRGLSLFLALVLTLGLLPTSALAGLVDNSRSQNERILEQLEALWGNEATAEEALALLKQYGLVDEDGNVITDWSDDIWLQAEPVPLSFGEAMDLSEGTVTVNGRTCDAGELRQALEAMEALGLLAEGAPLADWRLQVDGEDVAPAQLEAALTQAQADPAQEETPTEEEPAEEEGGVLATLARALELDGGEEPAGPAVTVLGTQVSDPDALEDLID